MNLIPVQRRNAARRRARVRLWCAGGGVYALALAGICAIVQSGRGQAQATASALTAASEQCDRLQTQVTAARGELSSAVAARETLATLADPPDWSLLLAGLPQSLGQSLLREIQLVPAATVKTPGDEPRQFRIALRGICHTQSELAAAVQSLQKLGLFSSVQLLRSGREPFGSGSGVAFDIDCVIGGGAPIGGDKR